MKRALYIVAVVCLLGIASFAQSVPPSCASQPLTLNIDLLLPNHSLLNWDSCVNYNFTLIDYYLGGSKQMPTAFWTNAPVAASGFRGLIKAPGCSFPAFPYSLNSDGSWNCQTPAGGSGGGNAVDLPLVLSGSTISIPQANGSTAGFLAATDWATFNGKQVALGFTPLNPANNLSELSSATTARANLGLGTAATQASTAFDAAGAAATVATNLTSETARAEAAEATKVGTSTTVNGHPLSANVVVSASDLTTGTLPVGRLPVIPYSDLSGTPSIPLASSATPNVDGTASPGSATTFSRGDHTHPTDTSRVATSTTVNGHALSANVTISASDLTTGTLPHAQLPALVSADIPNNAANTSGTSANLSGTPTLPSGTTLPGYVPSTITVNSHPLSSNVTVSASDVGNTVAQWDANEFLGVPFCNGFTPTNGQSLQYTTASSPNPCYTGAVGSLPQIALPPYELVNAGTGVAPVVTKGEVQVIPQMNWSQTIAGTLTGGVQTTVTLTPCPVGVDTTSGFGYQVALSGGGNTEAVPVVTEGGDCTSGASSGTIKFTPFYSYSGSFTIGSATAGVQETHNASCGVNPSHTQNGQCKVVIPPNNYAGVYNNYDFYGTLFLHGYQSSLSGYGASIHCWERGPCIQSGDLTDANHFPSMTIEGIHFRTDFNYSSNPSYVGVNITNTVEASGVMTYTTASAHGYRLGDMVTNLFTDDSRYWGDCVVASVPSSTTFTCPGQSGVSIASQNTPGVTALAYVAVLDNANSTALKDLGYDLGGEVWHFNNFFDFWDDENATVEHFNNNGITLNGNLNWTGSFIFSGGAAHVAQQLAPVITVRDSTITANGTNCATVYNSNGLHFENTTCQAQGPWEVYSSNTRGNYQGAEITNIYSQGASLNPGPPSTARSPFPGTGTSGLIAGESQLSARFSIHGGTGMSGATPTAATTFALTSVNGSGVYQGTITGGASNAFVGDTISITGFNNGGNNLSNAVVTASSATSLSFSATTTIETHAATASGSTNYNYYIVAHDCPAGSDCVGHPNFALVTSPMPIMTFGSTGSDQPQWYYPRIANFNDVITYDVIRELASNGIPSSGNCGGGTVGTCGSVATGIAQCSGLVCSYTDTAIASATASYPYPVNTGGYQGNLNFWPGALVVVGTGTHAWPVDVDSEQSPAVGIGLDYGAIQTAKRCGGTPGTGGYSICFATIAANALPNQAAMLLPDGFPLQSQTDTKGRLNILDIGTSVYPHDILTLHDSQPTLTEATSGYRPPASVNDIAMSQDAPGGTSLANAQSAWRCGAVSCSMYINSLPDNVSWIFRGTSTSATFAHEVVAPEFCIGSSCITAWPSGGGMVYPTAGLPCSTGSAWCASYVVGSAGSDIPQLSSGLLPSSEIPNNAANTSGTAANLSGTPTLPSGTVLPGYVPSTITVNTHALNANVILSASDITTGTLPVAQLPPIPYADLTGTPSIPAASSTTPNMDGTGAAGSATTFARGDHTHPSDTSRVATTTTVNGHALSSNVTVSASDLTTGTLPHAQLPALVSADIPNNAANTSGNAASATNATEIGGITVTGTPSTGYVPTATSGSAATWQAPSGGFSPTITSPATSQTLVWNGSAWVNSYGGVNVDPYTGNATFSCTTDRNGELEFNITASATLTLPQAGATACTQSNMAMVVRNASISTATLTISPTTSTFLPEASTSINVIPGGAVFVYSDAVSGTGNYHDIPIPTAFGGVSVKTANYTLSLLDKDKMIVMNCTSACVATLPATPPSSKWNAAVLSIGTTLATVSLNSLNFNGTSTAPILATGYSVQMRTDGTNYFGDIASSQVNAGLLGQGAYYAAAGTGVSPINGIVYLNTLSELGAQINAAVTALGTNGGFIKLPQTGTAGASWSTTATITQNNITLEGWGPRSSVFNCTVAGDCLLLNLTSDYYCQGTCPGSTIQASGGRLANFAIRGNGATGQNIIHTQDMFSWNFENLLLDGANEAGGACLLMENVTYWTERNIQRGIEFGYECTKSVRMIAAASHPSFGYDYFQWELSPGSSQTGVSIESIIQLYHGRLDITLNMFGTSSTGILVSAAALASEELLYLNGEAVVSTTGNVFSVTSTTAKLYFEGQNNFCNANSQAVTCPAPPADNIAAGAILVYNEMQAHTDNIAPISGQNSSTGATSGYLASADFLCPNTQTTYGCTVTNGNSRTTGNGASWNFFYKGANSTSSYGSLSIFGFNPALKYFQSGLTQVALLGTIANCNNGASPAVCAAAPSGAVALPTGTNPTLVVNTTAVTATSQIHLTVDESLVISGVTCNTTLSTLLNPVVTARSAGVSFTFTIGAIIASNPACVSYTIVN